MSAPVVESLRSRTERVDEIMLDLTTSSRRKRSGRPGCGETRSTGPAVVPFQRHKEESVPLSEAALDVLDARPARVNVHHAIVLIDLIHDAAGVRC